VNNTGQEEEMIPIFRVCIVTVVFLIGIAGCDRVEKATDLYNKAETLKKDAEKKAREVEDKAGSFLSQRARQLLGADEKKGSDNSKEGENEDRD
jgi:hypothetical protein